MGNAIATTFSQRFPDAGSIIITEGTNAFAVGAAGSAAMLTGLGIQRIGSVLIPRLYDNLVLDNVGGIVITSTTICFTAFSIPYGVRALFQIFREGRWMRVAVVLSALIGIFTPQAVELVKHFWPDWAKEREELLRRKREEQN